MKHFLMQNYNINSRNMGTPTERLHVDDGKPVDNLAAKRTTGLLNTLESLNEESSAVPGIRSSVQEDVQASVQAAVLTPEEAEATLIAFQSRFEDNMYLHRGIEWPKVKAALEADPKALLTINKAQSAGHEPDVYIADNQGFDIGTCSKESPESGRNCVFDKEAADWLTENRPNEIFNGSAAEMSEAMGLPLMSEEQYRYLRTLVRVDDHTWNYLATPAEVRNGGQALAGNCLDEEDIKVDKLDAKDHYIYAGWRGSLRVNWA